MGSRAIVSSGAKKSVWYRQQETAADNQLC